MKATQLKTFINTVGAFFFILTGYLQTHAQTFNFNHYSNKDGLIQSNVNDILQDKEGYIWFATEGGLSKFNGQTFVNFSTNDGLSEASVSTICQDNIGKIWIGHTLGKVSLYDGQKFENFELKLKETPNRICDISPDNNNNLWISTVGSGAIHINPKTKSYTTYSIKENLTDIVFMSYTDVSGRTWFVTDIGIKYFEPISNTFLFFKPKGFPFFDYTCMTQDKNGDFWFGTTNQGIIKYTVKDSTSTQFSLAEGLESGFITGLITSPTNEIWVGTWEGGISKIQDLNILTISPKNGLPGSKIKSLFIDRESLLWVGMQDKGIAQFKGFRFIHYGLGDGINNTVINCIADDKQGNYWLGTNNGIDIVSVFKNYMKKSIRHIDLENSLGNNLVTSLCVYGNKIFISTFKGNIGVYDLKSGKSIQTISINNSLINNLTVINNDLWISASTGLTSYNLNTATFKDYTEMDKRVVLKVHQDSQGVIWVGTRESGLWYFQKDKLKQFNKINHNSPTSFCNDKLGYLWIGTEGGGLYKKSGSEIINFTVKDGLNSDYLTLVTSDSIGNIWAGTNTGLIKYNPLKNDFVRYGIQEGFSFIETKNNAVLNDSKGNIWFGTVNGATLLNLSETKGKDIAPIVYLTNYEIFSVAHSLIPNAKFNHTQNEITFNFIGLSFRNPTHILYEYKLEGLDDKWRSEYGINKAVFSHLPPGEYKFLLKASNSEGVYTNQTIAYSFEIIPPIYKRIWFISLIVVIIMLLIFAYVAFRTKYLRDAKEILEKQVKERTLEIEHKNDVLILKNSEIENKNKEITDSINYAKRIQEAILPSIQHFKKIFPESFVMYRPKDIVSGDFYWFADIKAKSKNHSEENDIYVSVADCTGHGVPGAFMCMIGNALLNQIVQESNDFRPSKTLELLNIGVRDALKQQETETRDGMDIALCHINRTKKVIEFSGAMRSLILFRGASFKQQHNLPAKESVMQEIKADKLSIGGIQGEILKEFTNYRIPYYPGDTIYLYTDGFADQFGGERGKKLMSKRFKELLHDIQECTMEEQQNSLNSYFNSWRGDLEQVDDVLVIGIRLV